jgi:hypothetical protein
VKKRKNRVKRPTGIRASSSRETLREISNFLKALDSYPAQFSRRPDLSFKQYFRTISAKTTVAENSEN